MVKMAGAQSLPVSIEPHMDSMAQTPERALKLLKAVPGLKLTLDWAQLVCADARHEQIVELLPHARYVQLRQAARAQLQLPFDRGRIDVDRVVKALRDADYDGVVCVEYVQNVGWHGAEAVDAIREVTHMRDALRAARDATPVET